MTNHEQRSDGWHKQRVGRVTGSRVGAILGLNPWQTREDVMRAMVRNYHGLYDENISNIATEYGTNNEPIAMMHYERSTGHFVDKAYFAKYEDWLGASPDGLIGDDGLVEIKCPFGRRNDADFKSIEEQHHYYAQIQCQLFVTGREWCDFWQWSKHGHKCEQIYADKDWVAKNIPRLRQFHAEYLSELDNPEHLQPKRIELNSLDAKRLLQEYDDLKDAISLAQERQKEVLAEIVNAANEKDAEIWGRKLTLVRRAGSVQYAKIVKDHLPDIDTSGYVGKESEYWRLT